LAVCEQTVREATRIGIEAAYVRDGQRVPETGLLVTNYEMVEHFDPALLGAVVLDEASILKQSDGKTRTRLIKHFAPVRSRLACTATPAPNDPEELTNQAEFLRRDAADRDAGRVLRARRQGMVMKGHAAGPMYRWMTSWAMALRYPSDIGYSDEGYILPKLNIIPEIVHVAMAAPEGHLFRADIGGVGRARAGPARDAGRASATGRWNWSGRAGRAVAAVDRTQRRGRRSGRRAGPDRSTCSARGRRKRRLRPTSGSRTGRSST
jgi:hypothetical protein